MDRLPPEVFEPIAIAANSDGGRAGCALAAVSREYRYMFAPWRYRSVDLRGPRQIRAFLALVEWSVESSTESWDKRSATLDIPMVQVLHLFLSDCRVTHAGDGYPNLTSCHWADWSSKSEGGGIWDAVKGLFGQQRSFEVTMIEYSATAQDVVERLLSRLTESLTHLHFLTWMPLTWVLVPDLVFPSLLELTCGFPAEEVSYRWLSKPKLGHALALPILRRLHMIITALPERTSSRISEFGQLPPSLTQIRISSNIRAKYLQSSMLYLARNEPNWLPSQLESILLAHHSSPHLLLRYLLTPSTNNDPQAPYLLVYSSSPGLEAPDHYPDVHAGTLAWAEVGVRVFVTDEECPWNQNYLCDDWLNRVQGGTGCWVEGIPLTSEA
jgi:hypothetical protein